MVWRKILSLLERESFHVLVNGCLKFDKNVQILLDECQMLIILSVQCAYEIESLVAC